MTPRTLAVIGSFLVLGIVGVVAGRAWPLVPAVATVVVLAVALTVVLGAVEDRRVRRLAEEIDAWVDDGGPRPVQLVQLSGSSSWRRLAAALETLGADYRRRVELTHELPWRREMVHSMVQPALLFGGEGRLLAANDDARSLLGIPAEADGITVLQAVGSAVLAETVREAQDTGRPVTVDVEHGDHDLRAVGSVVGGDVLLIITDHTRERRVEELRRNFVVNASHELKTPVTSIQTLSEALRVTVRDDPDRSVSLVMRLGVEAERLAHLVRDLLDLRRLEERGPLERDAVDLAELVRLTVAELIPPAEAREVALSVDAPDHAVVTGVPGDLEVIVKNLVANAVQYNRPSGTVEVTIRVEEGAYVMKVIDTGIGIPHQDLGRIFERFYRVDAARSRATGGTGLGLSIVRHAVEGHGGTIGVESLFGEGTTFTVTLPIDSALVGD